MASDYSHPETVEWRDDGTGAIEAGGVEEIMPRPLRVALLATVVDFGGIERVLLTLLRHIGAETELFPVLFTRATDERNYFLESLGSSKVPYRAIHVDTSRYKYLNPLRNIGETIAYCKAERFDLIHTHGYRADFIGFVVAKCLGLPILSTCHGFISIDRHLNVYNKLDTFLLRFFNRIIAVSDQMKKDLVERGVGEDRIQVITNAISEESTCDSKQIRQETRSRLGIGEYEFVFGFVGRLSEEKGLSYLMEALKMWASRDTQWRLVVVGEGPQRGALESAVRDSGLGSKVHFAGFQVDTAAWYPALDAFVLPSLTEGTPMVLLEAMAAGIPVIATSVGGVPAMIADGENGILVRAGDAVGLIEAMHSLAEDHDLRERLRVNALHLIRKNYSVAHWIKQSTDAYVSTLQQSRRR